MAGVLYDNQYGCGPGAFDFQGTGTRSLEIEAAIDQDSRNGTEYRGIAQQERFRPRATRHDET